MAAIGLYGGSFNPIHLGHLNLAIELKEKGALDEIWLCPAHLNPHKQQVPLVAVQHRVAMINHAIAGIEGFSLCDLELNRAAPSYTIDTIEALLARYSTLHNFHLLMGQDAAENFPQWHRAADIVDAVPLLIGCRSSNRASVQSADEELSAIARSIKRGMVPSTIFDISSTAIRQRLAMGKFCGHLLREKVLDYILLHRLYC